MGGDDYIICRNTKHSDAHQAAHDLDNQVDALKEALDFYAKEENWGTNLGGECVGDACDRGERARSALGRETDYSKFKDED